MLPIQTRCRNAPEACSASRVCPFVMSWAAAVQMVRIRPGILARMEAPGPRGTRVRTVEDNSGQSQALPAQVQVFEQMLWRLPFFLPTIRSCTLSRCGGSGLVARLRRSLNGPKWGMFLRRAGIPRPSAKSHVGRELTASSPSSRNFQEKGDCRCWSYYRLFTCSIFIRTFVSS